MNLRGQRFCSIQCRMSNEDIHEMFSSEDKNKMADLWEQGEEVGFEYEASENKS